MLDGEGGYTVYSKLIPAIPSSFRRRRASSSAACRFGLAHHVKLMRDVPAGAILTASDVALDAGQEAVRIRAEMERQARQAAARWLQNRRIYSAASRGGGRIDSSPSAAVTEIVVRTM